MRQSNLTRQTILLLFSFQTDRSVPEAPQSQHTSFPGMRSTSSIMALVRSSSPSSPPPCSPLKAMLSASSLLLVNTEIHLQRQKHINRTQETFSFFIYSFMKQLKLCEVRRYFSLECTRQPVCYLKKEQLNAKVTFKPFFQTLLFIFLLLSLFHFFLNTMFQKMG